MSDIYSLGCGKEGSDTAELIPAIESAITSQNNLLLEVMAPLFQAINTQITSQQSQLVSVQKQISKTINKQIDSQSSTLASLRDELYTQIAQRITEQGVQLNLVTQQLAGLEQDRKPTQAEIAAIYQTGGQQQSVNVTQPPSVQQSGPPSLSQTIVNQEQLPQTAQAVSQPQPQPDQRPREVIQQGGTQTIVQYGQGSNVQTVTQIQGGSTTVIQRQKDGTFGTQQYSVPVQPNNVLRQILGGLQQAVAEGGLPGLMEALVNAVTPGQTSNPLWQAIGSPGTVPQPIAGQAVTPLSQEQINTVTSNIAQQVQEQQDQQPPSDTEPIVDPWQQPGAYRLSGADRRWKAAARAYYGTPWTVFDLAGTWEGAMNALYAETSKDIKPDMQPPEGI